MFYYNCVYSEAVCTIIRTVLLDIEFVIKLYQYINCVVYGRNLDIEL